MFTKNFQMTKKMKELKCNQELNLYYKKINEHYRTGKLQHLKLMGLVTDWS